MTPRLPRGLVAAGCIVLAAAVAGCHSSSPARHTRATAPPPPGPKVRRARPPVDSQDVYAADRPGRLSRVVRRFPSRVYVPNSRSDTVDVIDPHTYKAVGHFRVGALPQHVTPSYDLKTLWVGNDLGTA